MVIKVDNEKEKIEALVDVVQLSLPKVVWLSEPERRFFVETVLLKWEGVDISKKKGVDATRQRMGWVKESRQPYKFRTDLKSKGWMKKKRGKWVLPETFVKNPGNDIKVQVEIKMTSNDRGADSESGE